MRLNLGRFAMAGALLASAGLAGAADKKAAPMPGTDAAVAEQVRHEIAMYPRYSIWDDVRFSVNNGTVELSGAVNVPVKKEDIDKIVRSVPGVAHVEDEIRVLPLSSFDDRLRLQVARAIYRDPAMRQYAMQPVGSIHVIVDNGHVTLTGSVATEFDKEIAGVRASSAGTSFGPIVNNLQVEHLSKKS